MLSTAHAKEKADNRMALYTIIPTVGFLHINACLCMELCRSWLRLALQEYTAAASTTQRMYPTLMPVLLKSQHGFTRPPYKMS